MAPRFAVILDADVVANRICVITSFAGSEIECQAYQRSTSLPVQALISMACTKLFPAASLGPADCISRHTHRASCFVR